MKRNHWLWAIGLIVAAVAATSANADSDLPQIGGAGGAQYRERCPQGQVLNGFELRAGDDIDAIRAVCVTPLGVTAATAPPLSNGFGGGWHGGGGGGLQRLLCPPGTPVVTAVSALFDGIDTISLDAIDIYCGPVAASAVAGRYPSNHFRAPVQGCTHLNFGPYNALIDLAGQGRFKNHCPNPQVARHDCPAGEIGIGMHGHSGALVDAMGLICGPAPRFAAEAQHHEPKPTPLQSALRSGHLERARRPATPPAVLARPRRSLKSIDATVTRSPATLGQSRSIIIVGGDKAKPAKKTDLRERINAYQRSHD